MVNQLFTIASMIELIVAITIAMSPGEQQTPKLDWWRDARFGMFIHWGPYSNDMYMFALSSDDGSRFLIGDTVVVDNDGLHGTQELYGSFPLANGWHKFRLEWFNKAGGASLNIRMGVVGCELIEIPSTSFASIE
jgi:hypothetical protein